MINYEPYEPKGIVPLCIKRCFNRDALGTVAIMLGILMLMIGSIIIICTVE